MDQPSSFRKVGEGSYQSADGNVRIDRCRNATPAIWRLSPLGQPYSFHNTLADDKAFAQRYWGYRATAEVQA